VTPMLPRGIEHLKLDQAVGVIEPVLSEAGMECPSPTHNLNLSPEAENSSPATRALSDWSGKPSRLA
jgi:hypothetical protein